jgi:hypothetical protein
MVVGSFFCLNLTEKLATLVYIFKLRLPKNGKITSEVGLEPTTLRLEV